MCGKPEVGSARIMAVSADVSRCGFEQEATGNSFELLPEWANSGAGAACWKIPGMTALIHVFVQLALQYTVYYLSRRHRLFGACTQLFLGVVNS